MFYLKDGWCFGRNDDASVRILKQTDPKQGFSDQWIPLGPYLVDLTIDQEGWASIISSVSINGEASGGFYRALEFHNKIER